eukprot:1417862-Prymnesium_polylepis.1
MPPLPPSLPWPQFWPFRRIYGRTKWTRRTGQAARLGVAAWRRSALGGAYDALIARCRRQRRIANTMREGAALWFRGTRCRALLRWQHTARLARMRGGALEVSVQRLVRRMARTLLAQLRAQRELAHKRARLQFASTSHPILRYKSNAVVQWRLAVADARRMTRGAETAKAFYGRGTMRK